jgi:DNA-binding CsgD family transcriptional regulator
MCIGKITRFRGRGFLVLYVEHVKMPVLQTPLAASEFIGRQSELAALEALVDGALAGQGGFALIGGDAGMGKTRLCRELKLSAAARGVRVIEGRSSPAEASSPYGPFMDALRFRIARGERDAAAEVMAPVLAHVAPLVAGLAAQPRTVAAATAAPFEPIWRVLERLAGLGPTLLVIEDVHWADATSHDLLLYLSRRLGGLPLVLVATYRTDEVAPGHSVYRLATSLARERTAVRVQLEPMSSAETARLLRSMLAAEPHDALVAAVQRRAEGNPFYVEELVGVLLAATDAADITAEAVSRLAAPTTLQEVVWERLALLEEDAREALIVAAIAGRRFRFDVLARALDWDEERLLPAMESLVASRLLAEVGADMDETYEFRHSLVQEVLYGTVIGRRRRVWHRRVAEALESVASSIALPHSTLAHHFRQAGDIARARDHAVHAADDAARLCAWKDAEALYESALDACERSDADPALQAYILERMAEVAWWQNRIAVQSQYLDEAIGIRRATGDARGVARLLHRRAVLDADQRGSEPRAIAALEEALALVEVDAPERALIANELGRLRMQAGAFDEATRQFTEALAVSGSKGECGEDAYSLAMLGLLAVQRGECAAGTQRLELARSLLEEEPHAIEREAAVFLAGIRAFDACRDHRRGAEWVAAAMAYARQHHATADHAVFSAYRAAIQRRAGSWDSAVQEASAAVQALRAAGRAELREALRILGDLERGRGHLDAAAIAYGEATRLGDADAAVGLALVHAAERNWEVAARKLEELVDVRPDGDRLFRLRVLPILVEAYAESGDGARAAEAHARLRTLLSDCDYPPGAAVLAQGEAWLHGLRGGVDAAADCMRRAVAAWAALDLPFEEARTTLLLGEHFARNGRGAEAVEAVQHATRALETMGAALEVARAHALLRSLGLRVRRRPTKSPTVGGPLEQLTPRELDVLAELARGSTNKRIARTLSMSPRTVGNHVSSILAKLGCATRTEASRLVLEARPHGVDPAARAGRPC